MYFVIIYPLVFGISSHWNYLLVLVIKNVITITVVVRIEVNKPGTYPIMNEKATLLEVLGLGGDLTQYGDRKNVHLIRTENNQTKDFYIDLTDANSVTADTYFLHPD